MSHRPSRCQTLLLHSAGSDGTVDFLDLGILKSVFFSADADADLNGDGTVDFLDLGQMKTQFFGPPGPSGLACAGTIPCPLGL